MIDESHLRYEQQQELEAIRREVKKVVPLADSPMQHAFLCGVLRGIAEDHADALRRLRDSGLPADHPVAIMLRDTRFLIQRQIGDF